MKLRIKDKYFKMIKSGIKKVDLRDAHITFVNESTGEEMRKEISDVAMIIGEGVDVSKKVYPNCFEDDKLIAFRLED